MRSCALSAQVEVLHSSYRRLHLLRGEQVRAASLRGGGGWGTRTREYYAECGGNV